MIVFYLNHYVQNLDFKKYFKTLINLIDFKDICNYKVFVKNLPNSPMKEQKLNRRQPTTISFFLFFYSVNYNFQ